MSDSCYNIEGLCAGVPAELPVQDNNKNSGSRPNTDHWNKTFFTMTRTLADLRKLPRHQLNRLTKDDMMDCILSSSAGEEVALIALTDRINAVVNELAEVKRIIASPDNDVNKKISELQQQSDKQSEIISRQQRFLENIDRKEREKNIVILGVPDENEALEGAVTEEDKLSKIWVKVGVVNVLGSHRRLGNNNNNNNNTGTPRRRPILLTLEDKDQRSKILENASKLKTSGEIYSKIYVKKDVHPSVRNEWRRLREVEKHEKERPENAGCTIRLDTQERKLYRDAVVIDTWNAQFF